MHILACLIIMLGVSNAVLVKISVVFSKVGEITTTRSRWLITFVIDLDPYERFLKKLTHDVEHAFAVAKQVVQNYKEPGKQGFLNSFIGLGKEIRDLRATRELIVRRFTDYRSLQWSKRSLIPFLGKALGFLFGTVSEEDLDVIRSSVDQLSRNQQEIAHVVAESITVLNISRVQIADNRHSINGLISSVHAIDEKISRPLKRL